MNHQETWWSGNDGVAYTNRNPPNHEASVKFFSRTLGSHVTSIRSAIEFGANDGRNLRALKFLGIASVAGVEINRSACADLAAVVDEYACVSMCAFRSLQTWDLAFTKGCLIHIHPDELESAYETLYRHTKRYVLLAEYHSARFHEIYYQGERNLLWAGPYADEMIKAYPDLCLLDYGFISRLDNFPEDDLCWFLLQK